MWPHKVIAWRIFKRTLTAFPIYSWHSSKRQESNSCGLHKISSHILDTKMVLERHPILMHLHMAVHKPRKCWRLARSWARKIMFSGEAAKDSKLHSIQRPR